MLGFLRGLRAGFRSLLRWAGFSDGADGIEGTIIELVGLAVAVVLLAGIGAFFLIMGHLYAKAFGSAEMAAIGCLIVAVQLGAVAMASDAAGRKQSWAGWAGIAGICIATNVWMLYGAAASVQAGRGVDAEAAKTTIASLDERLKQLDYELTSAAGAMKVSDARSSLSRVREAAAPDGKRSMQQFCGSRTASNEVACDTLTRAEFALEDALKREALERDRAAVQAQRDKAGQMLRENATALADAEGVGVAALIRAGIVDLSVSFAMILIGVRVGRRRREREQAEAEARWRSQVVERSSAPVPAGVADLAIPRPASEPLHIGPEMAGWAPNRWAANDQWAVSPDGQVMSRTTPYETPQLAAAWEQATRDRVAVLPLDARWEPRR